MAAELLKRANELIKNKVHPTNIITGFKIAAKEACAYIKDHLSISVETLGREALINAAKTSMSSKLIGPESNLFSEIVVEAIESIKMTNLLGESKYPIKNVKIIKSHG